MITAVISFDVWFENLMLAIRTPFWLRAFEAVTFFGSSEMRSPTIIVLAGVVGIVLLARPRYRPFLAGFVTTLAGAAVSGLALKDIVQRARPDGLIPAITESGFSFPSGHAVASMAFYGFVAFLLCRQYPRHAKLIGAAAAAIILAIGFSRLYLGVHFPSDVIAGYVLGGLWLLIGIEITNRFLRR
ncbi:MAG: phosphatase PAP2 family protein [Minisyncoccota bacterium]